MQIAPLNSSSSMATGKSRSVSLADDLGVAAASEVAEGQPASVSGTAVSATATPVLRSGLSHWDQGLNGELASAQQTLDFLDQSASQLQSLKSELSAKLAGQQTRDNQLDAKLRQFSTTWDQRQTRSGGSLSSQLAYSSPAPAVQRFNIRGLNIKNLQSGGKETLSFSVGGAGQSLRSVNIDPGLSADEIVQRFDQALAPANIRVSADDSGALVFSTGEADWASLRDTLSIKGDGIRFPAGQLNRVRPDAEPAAIQPAGWQISDVESMRQTLSQVVQALNRLMHAREAVSRALAQANSRVDRAAPSDDAATLSNLANSFAASTSQPDYTSFSSITAALLGISRDRVLSLLSLR
ncbi:hypothetical protein [Undibacterium terreum]|nr:hypothetical protein [Undibacterium terreum]